MRFTSFNLESRVEGNIESIKWQMLEAKTLIQAKRYDEATQSLRKSIILKRNIARQSGQVYCEQDDRLRKRTMPHLPLDSIQQLILIILGLLWACLLFGGFIFGTVNDEGTRRMPTWTRMTSSFTLVIIGWLWWMFTRDPRMYGVTSF